MTQYSPPSVGPVSDPWLCNVHVESFMASLRASGYAACKLPDKSRIAEQFVRWARTEQIPTVEVNESHVTEHLESAGQPSTDRFAFKRALLRGFLRHLRNEGVVPRPQTANEDTPAKLLEQEFADYLRDERGLASRSLLVYLPLVRTFIDARADRTGNIYPSDLSAEIVRTFLLDRIRARSAEYARLQTVALRSFLYFLFLRGETAVDLSLSVTTVRKPQGAEVHPFLLPLEVERVLSTPDLATPTGRRDHAILLLLARLGLRGGEVVTLELDDISWRTGELVVRGKGRVHDRLPLLKDVGAALALYIQSDRGSSECRRVFLRCIAPRVGLSGPAAIGHIVRKTLVQAGLQRPSGVAAHLLRHSLATQMIRHGASLPEISEVLRHRSTTTTEIYTKVAFESLREVARPWPGGEVVR